MKNSYLGFIDIPEVEVIKEETEGSKSKKSSRYSKRSPRSSNEIYKTNDESGINKIIEGE